MVERSQMKNQDVLIKSLLNAPKMVVYVLIVLIAAGVFYYFFYYQKNDGNLDKTSQTETSSNYQTISLDPQKEATYLSQVADTKGVYWQRGFDFTWNEIEIEKGKFDWTFSDQRLKELSEMEVYPLVIVKPFANWDQDTCHPEANYQTQYDSMKGGKLKVGAPCDMSAYSNFLTKAVERYDGDGIDDMPGLSLPIKYWEILNEPEMQGGQTGGMGEELKFFVGTSEEYFDILKTSYQTIKKADPEAKVAHAGMAGMQQSFQDFWDPVFAAGAGDYFDIANIHTINTDDKREDCYMIKFLDYLKKYNIDNKPIWITELQYGELAEKPTDFESFEILMVKSSVLALALGADKLFYIDNWITWDQKDFFAQKDQMPQIAKDKSDDSIDYINEDKIEMDNKKAKEEKPKISQEILDSSTHKVYLNLVDKINGFDRLEIIKQEYKENNNDHDGVTSAIGQYKFTYQNKDVYVMWGKAELPTEISGKAESPEQGQRIKVTDIYGQNKEMEAQNIKLSNQPIFVERK